MHINSFEHHSFSGISKKIICAFLTLFLVARIGFSQLPQGQLVSSGKLMTLSLVDPQKEILVRASLKGEEFTFLLDTGAPFFISNTIQDKYNFPVLFKADLSDASGKKDETLIVSIDSLTIGPFLFRDVWAVVIKMDNETHQCHEFVGNFGSNLLNFLTVQFDLQKGKVFLTDDTSLLDHQPTTFQPATLSAQRDFYFPISINDGITDTIHFDSGDGSLYEISPRALKKLVGKDSSYIIKKGFGITGVGSLGLPDQANQYILKSNLAIGNSVITGGIANNTYAEKSRLGRYLFHYGRMTLDYPNQQFAFEPFEKPDLPGISDFGFTVVASSNRVLTGTVWNDSEAEKMGMFSGCEITQINKIKFNDLDPCEVENALNLIRNKTVIKLTYRDKSGRPRSVKIKKSVYSDLEGD